MRRPAWVVHYNIISDSRWIGTGSEYFDDEVKAKTFAAAIPPEGYRGPVCGSARPYYHEFDKRRLGAAHMFEIQEEPNIIEALSIL